MDTWTPKPGTIRITFSDMTQKDVMTFLDDIAWEGDREAVAVLVKLGLQSTEGMWLEVDATGSNQRVAVYFFFSVSEKLLNFLVWLEREKYMMVDRVQGLCTDPNTQVTHPPAVRTLDKNKSEFDDVGRKLSSIRLTFTKKEVDRRTDMFFELLDYT